MKYNQNVVYLQALLSIYLFVFCDSHAQTLDSLHKALESTSDDSLRTDILNNLSYQYSYNDTKKAKYFAREALKLAKKNGFHNQEAFAYNHLGLAYLNQNNYYQAQRFFQESHQLFKKINNLRGQGITLNNMGLVLEYKVQYQEALKKYFDALAISQKTDRLADISMCFNNIGNIYFMLDDYEKALEYYQKCLAIDKKNKDDYGMANSLGNIALSLKNLKKYEEASKYYKEAIILAIKIKDIKTEIHTLTNLASLLQEAQQYDKASTYLSEAEAKANNYGDKFLIGSVLNVKIITLQSQQEYRTALKVAQQLYQLAKKINSHRLILSASERLSELCAEFKDFEQAFEFSKIYKAYHDSIFTEKQTQKVYNIELERKELEKEILVKEQALKNAEIFTQQKAIQMQYIIIAVIFLLLTMLAVWLYFLQKAHQKQKQLQQILENQNKQILNYTFQLEEKNTELEDSKEEIQLLNENLEEKVKERTRTLEIANEKLRNYSFLNSHAVRRPLANILGLVNILDYENPESEENKAYLEMLSKSAYELDEVIHDINQQLGSSEKTV